MKKAIVVTGPRDLKLSADYLLYQLSLEKYYTDDIYIIQGGASGVDNSTRYVCEKYGIKCVTIEADWAKYGKIAGPTRNKLMAETENLDLVLAFVRKDRPVTSGTSSMIAEGVRRNVRVRVVNV